MCHLFSDPSWTPRATADRRSYEDNDTMDHITKTYRRPPTVIGVPLEKIGVPLRGAPIFLGGRATTKPSALRKSDKIQIFYLLVRRQSSTY